MDLPQDEPITDAASDAQRPWMLTVGFKDRGSLATAYMPFVKNGGIFVATTRQYHLGESVFVLLSLTDEGKKFPITGEVVWVTPREAGGGRTPGIGVQFPEDEEGTTARTAIEQIIDNIQASLKKTLTL